MSTRIIREGHSEIEPLCLKVASGDIGTIDTESRLSGNFIGLTGAKVAG